MARRHGGEEGFSLIETMFAAFIAFVVLTAIFSVIVVSSQVNRASRSDVRATTLANQVVEQARSLPYGMVGIVGGDPEGQLIASETTVVAGITYTIEREVTWVDDTSNGAGGENGKDYKQLVVRVKWGEAGIRFVTFIRDRAEEAFPPTVTWIQVPNPDVIVFTPSGGSNTLIWSPGTDPNASNGSVVLQASAEATGSAGVITRVEFWTATRLLPGAAFKPSSPTLSYTTPAYSLNTRAVDGSGTPFMPDGFHTIRAEAWTAAGLRDYVSWSLFVDNDPPVWTNNVVTIAEPGASANQDRYNSRLKVTWSPPSDGGVGVANYVLYVAKNNSGTYSSHALSGPSIPFILATGQPTGMTVEPFSAFRVYLAGKSPRGLLANSGVSSWEFSNPRLTGTIRNNATKKNLPPVYVVALSVTPPSAGTLAAIGATSVKYDLYESTSWSGSADLTTKKSGFTDITSAANPVPMNITNPGTGKYYQIEAKCYNSAGTLVKSVRSNVIGPSGAADILTTVPIPVP